MRSSVHNLQRHQAFGNFRVSNTLRTCIDVTCYRVARKSLYLASQDMITARSASRPRSPNLKN